MDKFINENDFPIICPRCGGKSFICLYHREIAQSEHKSYRLVLACEWCYDHGIESKKVTTYHIKPLFKGKGGEVE